MTGSLQLTRRGEQAESQTAATPGSPRPRPSPTRMSTWGAWSTASPARSGGWSSCVPTTAMPSARTATTAVASLTDRTERAIRGPAGHSRRLRSRAMTDATDRGPRRDASVIVARDTDGKVAVLSADFPQHGGEYVFLPGGRREDGESPEECARRELREEAGVTAAAWHRLGSYAITLDSAARIRLFLAEELTDGSQLTPSEKGFKLMWWPMPDAIVIWARCRASATAPRPQGAPGTGGLGRPQAKGAGSTVISMDFPDALRAMKDGGRVARRSWIEPGKYIYRVPPRITALPGGGTVEHAAEYLFYRPHKGEHGLVESYAPLPDALEADDWYVVEDDSGSR